MTFLLNVWKSKLFSETTGRSRFATVKRRQMFLDLMDCDYIFSLQLTSLMIILDKSMTLCLAGTNGKVRLPAEDGEDVEENLEEALVRPQRRRAALLQVTGG